MKIFRGFVLTLFSSVILGPACLAGVIGGTYSVEKLPERAPPLFGSLTINTGFNSVGTLAGSVLGFEFTPTQLLLSVDDTLGSMQAVTWQFNSLAFSPGSPPLLLTFNPLDNPGLVTPTISNAGPTSLEIQTPKNTGVYQYVFSLGSGISSAVPEPSSLALCLIGGCGLWVVRKRRAAQG